MADPGFHTIKKIGEQDVYLTGNPEISHFKSVFRRHTRYFKQYKQINFDKTPDTTNFGELYSATIKHDHHLLGEMYVEMVIKGTSNAVNQYTVNHFGNSCIKSVIFKIGGRTIDTHTGQWLQIYKELHESNNNFSEIGSHNSGSGLGGGRKIVYNMDHTQDVYTCDHITPTDTWSLDDRIQGDYPLVFGGLSGSNITLSNNSITWTFDLSGHSSGKTNVWQTVGDEQHGLSIGDKVKMISAGGAPVNSYDLNGVYYVVEVPSITTVRLSATKGGPVITGSDDSSGTWKMQQIDYKSLMINSHGSYNIGDYEKKIRVPLRFFFNNNPGLALPMCALQRGGDPVRIDIQLESLANLKGDVNLLELSSIKLYAETYNLSYDELTRFKNGTHMYLIEQLQINGDTAIPSFTTGNTETDERAVDLRSIMHPVKYFTFVVQEEPSGGTKGIGPCYFRSLVPNSFFGNDGCYNDDTGSLKLMLDSDVTTERLPIDYYTRILPKRFCKGRIPDLDRIGIYSFALNPFNLDPSGTCNFSLFSQKQLNITLSGNQGNLEGYSGNKKLLIYAINYNIFRVIGGHGGVLYI